MIINSEALLASEEKPYDTNANNYCAMLLEQLQEVFKEL
jgi:hypothetical protein